MPHGSVLLLALALVCHSAAFIPLQLAPALRRRPSAAGVRMTAAKKKPAAVAFKGFGAMPQKLESRVPGDAQHGESSRARTAAQCLRRAVTFARMLLAPESADEPCECQSGLAYGQCCKPFHDGEKWPESPLQLMRSRHALLFSCACRAAPSFPGALQSGRGLRSSP